MLPALFQQVSFFRQVYNQGADITARALSTIIASLVVGGLGVAFWKVFFPREIKKARLLDDDKWLRDEMRQHLRCYRRKEDLRHALAKAQASGPNTRVQRENLRTVRDELLQFLEEYRPILAPQPQNLQAYTNAKSPALEDEVVSERLNELFAKRMQDVLASIVVPIVKDS